MYVYKISQLNREAFMNKPAESDTLMSSLKKELAFFKSIWNSSTEYSLTAVDRQGNIVAWNEGAIRIYGYDSDEIIGKSWLTLYKSDDEDPKKIQEILKETEEQGKWEG